MSCMFTNWSVPNPLSLLRTNDLEGTVLSMSLRMKPFLFQVLLFTQLFFSFFLPFSCYSKANDRLGRGWATSVTDDVKVCFQFSHSVVVSSRCRGVFAAPARCGPLCNGSQNPQIVSYHCFKSRIRSFFGSVKKQNKKKERGRERNFLQP